MNLSTQMFAANKKIGDRGEEIILDYLSRYHIVQDVSDNPDYFALGIDAFCDNRSIEIKTDSTMSRTGNMFVEYARCYDNYGDKGWFETSQAEFLLYFNPISEVIYCIEMDTLREYVKDNHCSVGVCDDKYKRVMGYLVKPETVAYQIIQLQIGGGLYART